MIGRLVSAQLWRLRWHVLLLLFLGALGAVGTSESASFSHRLSMWWPLLSVNGAITMLGIFWSRDVRVLPIQRHEALRSAWLAALVLPMAIATGRLLTTLVTLSLGFTVQLTVETIALTALWDTTFIGISLTLMQRPDDPWESVKQAFGNLRKSARLVLMLTWMLVVPLAGPEIVPQSLSDVTWLHAVGVLAGSVITAWPLVVPPDQWPRLGVLHDAVRTQSPTPARIQTKRRALDQLVGLRRLLPEPVGTAALIAVLTLAVSTAFTYSLEGARSVFSAGMTDIEFVLIGGPFFLLVLSPFSWANGITPFLRTLRALPVSAMTLVATMTILPLMMPVFFWTLATAGHLVVGEPGDARWRLESFALICGVMALSGAVHARFNSVITLMAGAVLPLIGMLMLMTFFDKTAVEPLITWWFPLMGLVGVPAAFLLNHKTITRGGSSAPVYRQFPGASLYRGGR